eukprot:8296440-Alexandrium_andersonii.AAC.1
MEWQQRRREQAQSRRQAWCGHIKEARYVGWEEPLQLYMRDCFQMFLGRSWQKCRQLIGTLEFNNLSSGSAVVSPIT